MLLTYVYRELRRRHRQALLTALGLAVGVGLVVAVTAYASGVSKAQDQVLQSLYGVGTDVSVTQTAKLDQSQGGPMQFDMNPGENEEQGQKFSRDQLRSSPGQVSISAKKIASIAKLDGVSASTGSLLLSATHMQGKFAQGQSSPSSASSQPSASASQAPIEISSFTLAGVDVTNTGLGPLSSSSIVSGRSLTSSDTKAKVALADKAYAKQQSLAVGDKVKVGGVKFEVVGIVTASSGTSSANVFIPLAWAQKLSDSAGKVNQIYVRATSADQIATVKSEIKTLMPKATVTTSEDLAEQVSGSLSSASSLAQRLGTWLAVAALIAAFLVACLLTVSAVSRRVREFGTLKALGWRSPRIVGQVLGESIVQGVVGGLVGVGIGVLGAKAIAWCSPTLKATLGSSANAGASQSGAGGAGGPAEMARSIGQAAQTVTVHLTSPVSVQLVLIALGLALTGALLAGTVGGWRASRLRPADALRRLD